MSKRNILCVAEHSAVEYMSPKTVQKCVKKTWFWNANYMIQWTAQTAYRKWGNSNTLTLFDYNKLLKCLRPDDLTQIVWQTSNSLYLDKYVVELLTLLNIGSSTSKTELGSPLRTPLTCLCFAQNEFCPSLGPKPWFINQNWTKPLPISNLWTELVTQHY